MDGNVPRERNNGTSAGKCSNNARPPVVVATSHNPWLLFGRTSSEPPHSPVHPRNPWLLQSCNLEAATHIWSSRRRRERRSAIARAKANNIRTHRAPACQDYHQNEDVVVFSTRHATGERISSHFCSVLVARVLVVLVVSKETTFMVKRVHLRRPVCLYLLERSGRFEVWLILRLWARFRGEFWVKRGWTRLGLKYKGRSLWKFLRLEFGESVGFRRIFKNIFPEHTRDIDYWDCYFSVEFCIIYCDRLCLSDCRGSRDDRISE